MKEKSIPKDELVALRKEIHKDPELSGEEQKTAKRLRKFIRKYKPAKVVKNLGGTGFAAIFNGKQEGNTVMIRGEMDALPIEEINEFDYRSQNEGVSHKCGHDGHSVMAAGVASLIARKPEKGRVILLFQPAEETGQGAEWVLNDEKFKDIEPDYIFALHNLPGYPLNTILLRKQNFAAASKGMIVELKGKTSHAAEPENGKSPAMAVSKIIEQLTALPQKLEEKEDFVLVTVIHAILGEVAFGTTPGEAKVMATLRSYKMKDMDRLTSKAEEIVNTIAQDEKLECSISFTEVFPATVNNDTCTDWVKEAAEEMNLDVKMLENPFRWSEDFGHFTQKYKGVLFGLGSGENHPQLHNPDYDFPDKLIETGVRMFHKLVQKALNS